GAPACRRCPPPGRGRSMFHRRRKRCSCSWCLPLDVRVISFPAISNRPCRKCVDHLNNDMGRQHGAEPKSNERANTSRPVNDQISCAMGISRFLIMFGLSLLIVGLAWPLLSKFGLGRLPGDIVIKRGKATINIPIATSLVVSIVLTLMLGLLGLIGR